MVGCSYAIFVFNRHLPTTYQERFKVFNIFKENRGGKTGQFLEAVVGYIFFKKLEVLQ